MSTFRRSARTVGVTIAAFAVVVGFSIGGPANAVEIQPSPAPDATVASLRS